MPSKGQENASDPSKVPFFCTTLFTVRLLLVGKYHISCREFFKFQVWLILGNNYKLQELYPCYFYLLSFFLNNYTDFCLNWMNQGLKNFGWWFIIINKSFLNFALAVWRSLVGRETFNLTTFFEESKTNISKIFWQGVPKKQKTEILPSKQVWGSRYCHR
jgi:hypothetical protein